MSMMYITINCEQLIGDMYMHHLVTLSRQVVYRRRIVRHRLSSCAFHFPSSASCCKDMPFVSLISPIHLSFFVYQVNDTTQL